VLRLAVDDFAVGKGDFCYVLTSMYNQCGLPGVTDSPTEQSVKAIILRMELGTRIRWRTINRDTIQRLRGTPGEPLPLKQSEVVSCIRWTDGFQPRFRFRGVRSGRTVTR